MTTSLRSKLPLSVALPLFVAIAMFVVAVGTTQIGVMVLRSSNETSLRDQALVFLDAVAGHIAAEIGEAGAEQTVSAQLAASLTYRTALLEEGIAARWTDRTGTAHTVVMADTGNALLTEALDAAGRMGPDDVSITLIPGEALLLAARSYPLEDRRLLLAATFDTTPIEDAATLARGVALGIDILVAIVAAIATYAVTRRVLRPLDQFIGRLADQPGLEARPMAWRQGGELRQLEAALALREQSEAQRAAMLEQMAQQERDSLLARMAAGIAHEVRNPLAGLKNGISTLRRFGEREEVRKETLDFLENGLDSIGRVVDVTLSTYRQRSGNRMVVARDIQDLELLIAPEARRARVQLAFRLDEHARIETDADALRQILVNLMLNAVRASPAGGTVTVGMTLDQGTGSVVLHVSDQGPGMPPELVAAIISGRVDDLPVERSIGIWIVSSLVERIGAELSIRSEDGTGTTVQLTLPAAAAGPAGRST